MKGHCRCHSLEIEWQVAVNDLQLTPRSCQCDYCLSKSARYLSLSGSTFILTIQQSNNHKIIKHGTQTAEFHECRQCGDLICVTSQINGSTYGVVNVNCLQYSDFDQSVKVSFDGESQSERIQRRMDNWCHPVKITTKAIAYKTDDDKL